MRNLVRRFRPLLLASLFLPVCLLEGSPALRAGLGEKTAQVVQMLQRFHYRKITLDDAARRDLRRDFLVALDPDGFFFQKEDEDQLVSIPMDPFQIRGPSPVPFFEATLARFQLRVQETLRMIDRIEKGDTAVNEPAHFVRDSGILFSANAEERFRRWKKLIQYRVLLQAFFRLPANRTAAIFTQTLSAQESNLRSSILAGERQRILRMLQHPEGFDNVAARIFINTIVSRYDPHSAFISAAQKKEMEAMLSSQAYSFGIVFSRSPSGETRIDRLIPGGPAWKSAQLNRDDVLLQLTFPDEKDRTVEAADLGLEDLYAGINNPAVNRLTLSVRKAGGLIQKVSLAKEKLAVEENNVAGFVLSGKRKIGYIYLPAFYTEWENPGGAVCANDVAKEILKLKREKIEGLILDLRNNGGGSVWEGLNLAGIFIDEGPILIRSSEGKERILKDPARGMVYDGPLIVLVNGRSASASEFFVAALRDYNRAVIVGTPTYGKGSGQIILPVVADPSRIEEAMRHPNATMDYLKVTTDLYYDLYGNTHQRRGIVPHIQLPDPLFRDSDGEKGSPHSIEGAPVAKTAQFQKGADLPIDNLRRRSEKRRSRFDEVMALSKRVQAYLYESYDLSLDPPIFFRFADERMQVFEKLEAAVRHSSGAYSVGTVSFDTDVLRMNPYRMEMYSRQQASLREDLTINEGYDIMMDLIDSL